MSTLTGNVINTEPANSNHKIVLGKNGNNKCDFYEYGSIWNFYSMYSGTAELVASIQFDGVHANLIGSVNGISIPGKYVSENFTDNACEELGVNQDDHKFIAPIRCDEDNGLPKYGAGVTFGIGDTQGYLYLNYGSPLAYIGAGNKGKFN